MQGTKLFLVLVATMSGLAAAATPTGREMQQVKAATPNLERCAQLFTQCVSCHGGNGAGVESGETPRIAGQHYPVLIKQLVDFRHGKRWDFRMEEHAKEHYLVTPQDIADVAGFVAQLDGGDLHGAGDGLHATDGARIFGSRCASCHGANGAGDAARAIPRLAGQHYGYLMRQMYDAVDGRRPTLQLVHPRKIEPLDFEEVRAVADYLSRIGWDTSDPPRAPAR
jgi:cytochrome c553